MLHYSAYARIAACILIWIAVGAAEAADLGLPDPKLTPGAVLTTDASKVCIPGYSKTVRHTSGRLKHEVYKLYGIKPKSGHYDVDHLIPLSIGGADIRENLWPEIRDTQPWNSKVKDRLEIRLHTEICAGRLSISDAQRDISRDWISAYKKYIRPN